MYTRATSRGLGAVRRVRVIRSHGLRGLGQYDGSGGDESGGDESGADTSGYTGGTVDSGPDDVTFEQLAGEAGPDMTGTVGPATVDLNTLMQQMQNEIAPVFSSPVATELEESGFQSVSDLNNWLQGFVNDTFGSGSSTGSGSSSGSSGSSGSGGGFPLGSSGGSSGTSNAIAALTKALSQALSPQATATINGQTVTGPASLVSSLLGSSATSSSSMTTLLLLGGAALLVFMLFRGSGK